MRPNEFDDPAFLARLRQGDPAAYRALIRRLHNSLIGVATTIIGSRAQAEEVVQDSWLAVFAGVSRFEGRSSLVTWIFSIVLNRARGRAQQEGRTVGLPALVDGTPPDGRAVPLSAFQPNGHWAEAPKLWEHLDPERVVSGRQLWDHVQTAIDRLPAGQRAVLILRDTEGRNAEETCLLLDISAENQRVLLHRARGRIRQTIDALTGDPRDAVVDRQSRQVRGHHQRPAVARAVPPSVSRLARLCGCLARIWAAASALPLAGRLVPGCRRFPSASASGT